MDTQVLNAMFAEGVEAYKARDYKRAREVAETLVCESPNDPNMMSLLAASQFREGNLGSALVTSRMVLNIAHALKKEHVDWWLTVANCLYRTYHKAPAIEAFNKALEIAPDDTDVLSSYSGFWIQYADAERAENLARKALEKEPESVTAQTHLGMALLLQDRWEEGWPHMEYRKKKDSWKRPDYPFRKWNGEKVDTLLIHGEQGLGDELFFCSLVPRLMDRADRVVVECSERLVPLLRRSLPCEVYGSLKECADNGVFALEILKEIDEIQAGLGKYDIWGRELDFDDPPPAPRDVEMEMWLDRPHIVAMGSLPSILKATRENCADNAYLIPDVVKAKKWRAKLHQITNGRPIVGVAWLGGTYDTHKVLRNPPREMFKRLSPEKYCLVSLQYTEGAQRQARDMGMLHFPQAIFDLDEHAALIASLDCVISVAQTSMHFAGALNTPTLALINQYPKWDCGREGPSVPWWKSVKAIRQKNDDWSAVFDEVLRNLGEEPHQTAVDLSHINIIGAEDAPSHAEPRAAE